MACPTPLVSPLAHQCLHRQHLALYHIPGNALGHLAILQAWGRSRDAGGGVWKERHVHVLEALRLVGECRDESHALGLRLSV